MPNKSSIGKIEKNMYILQHKEKCWSVPNRHIKFGFRGDVIFPRGRVLRYRKETRKRQMFSDTEFIGWHIPVTPLWSGSNEAVRHDTVTDYALDYRCTIWTMCPFSRLTLLRDILSLCKTVIVSVDYTIKWVCSGRGWRGRWWLPSPLSRCMFRFINNRTNWR